MYELSLLRGMRRLPQCRIVLMIQILGVWADAERTVATAAIIEKIPKNLWSWSVSLG